MGEVIIIPKDRALQARLEELGLAWDKNESVKSMETRLLRVMLKTSPSFVVPSETKDSECFGIFYDANCHPCPYSPECDFAVDCSNYTRMKMDDRIIRSGYPTKRCLTYEVI